MKSTLSSALALAILTASAAFTLAAPARADAMGQDSMMKSSMEKVDCSQAGSLLSDAAKGNPPAMTGDIDKDFMAVAMEHEKGTATLMKIEAQCGKDPKVKAMAAKQAGAEDARMEMFRNQSMSQ